MKNEMNELELSAEQRMHALLCAFVLGELDGDERAEVEAALAGSEALRAERERLEKTIGVVSGALQSGAAGSLSSESAAQLDSMVARRAPRKWYVSPWALAAAAIAVVAGGAVLMQRFRSEVQLSPGPDVVVEPKSEGELVSQVDRGSGAVPLTVNLTPKLENVPPVDATTSVPAEVAIPEILDVAKNYSGLRGSDFERADDPNATKLGFTNLLLAGNQPKDSNAPESKPSAPLDQIGLVLEQLDKNAPSQQPPATDPVVGTPIGVGGGAGGGSRSQGATAVLRVEATGSSGAAAPAKLKKDGLAASTSGPATSGGPASPGPSGPTTPGSASPSAPGGNWRRAGEQEVALGEPADAIDRKKLPGSVEAELSDFDEKAATGSDDFYLGKKGREQLNQRSLEQQRFELLRHSCLPRPNERPRDMFFRFWGDNPFELAALDKLSTFSADVDTASYALARRYLVDGHLPTKEQIRTEEFVNYFKGDVQPPSEGTFRVAMELAPSLFGDSEYYGDTSDKWMLRVALRGREVSKRERMPVALTFVVDVSGSMREENRLELVKHALRQLANQLDARDTISLVKFSNDAALILPPTSARNRDLIESAIYPLQPEGSTNTEAGLRMGYAQAAAGLTQGSNNRVVLLTDGVANVGITDPNALVAMVESSRKQGVMLNTVGVGMDNHNDNLLEQLADKGDGLCNYVDDEAEVRRALVDNFTGAFEAIARDVKLQVEFDPAQVERYRLLGYENRAIADADFRNAKIDAAEMGAGHQVVALYEIVRRNGSTDGPLATARVRWKAPYAQGVANAESNESENEMAAQMFAKQATGGFAQTSDGYRRSVLVGQFAEFLRRSVHARNDSLDRLIAESQALAGRLHDAEFDEFVSMVQRSRELVLAELRRRDWFDDCSDLMRHNRFLCEQLGELRHRIGDERRAEELEAQMRDVERRLEEIRLRLGDARGEADRLLIERLQADNVDLQRRVLELLDKVAAANR